MNILSSTSASLSMRLLAWLNIAVQVAFPLTAAFTPAIAGAENGSRFLHEQILPAIQTRTHTLQPGETPESVATKYNMSLDSLHRLNQFRTFAHGFDHLQAGDELDVPLAPLPQVRWDDAPATSASDKSTDDMQAHKVAGYASQAGRFLSASARSDAAASMTRGMATGAASGEIQQWLSRFGMARVQLDADKNFSLKNSQLDLLVPLYEQKDRLLFTQGSIHRTDDRTQANLGAGVRRFYDAWMFGANSFLDYDLSRDHARAGAGLEYWRDFLKLGFNGYIPLTGWKDSPDLTDYQERPARGWDVRAQYWLPALPQFGGKLTYEQYYGKEVALFGVDSRQRDPHAITAGVNYTPVPLLTFSAEQRQGAGSNAETRFGVDMNYQLGMPWQHQINPDAVAAMRSLAGSRYDLVERNNNIVLEYRKKEVIRLKTADLVTGHAGEQKSLGVSVNSKYGLERIDWSASSLIAAGGKIVQSGEDWIVVIPAYRADVNSYTVLGTAVDRKGNRSNQTETQVTVQAPQVSAVQSTFTPAISSLAADGRSVQTLTLSVKDTSGQPANIAVSDVKMTVANVADASVSSPVSKGAGVMEVTVTAGVQPTTLILTPVVQGVSLAAARVNISVNEPDAERSSFSLSPDTIPADNVSTAALTITLVSKEGLPVTGVKDSLSLALSQNNVRTRSTVPVTLSDITEVRAGTYVATIKGSRAGTYTIVPQYNAAPLGSLSATLTLTADSAVQANSAISLDNTTYTSGADMTVTVTLKDASNNAVAGEKAALTSTSVTVPNAVLKSSGWTDNGGGSYTAVYTATTASTGNQATLQLEGWSATKVSGAYAITADSAVQANSAISLDNTTYTSGADMTVTVTLKDASNNAVAGEKAALTSTSVTVPNAVLKSSGWTDNGGGSYTAVYTATTASTGNQATLQLEGWSAAKVSGAYAITADSAVQANSAISLDNTTYTSGADMTVTVTLKDASNNAVAGEKAALTSTSVTVPNAVLKSSGWTDNGGGSYTAVYTATTASTGNQATLQLEGWSTTVHSGAYAISPKQYIISGLQSLAFYPRNVSIVFTPDSGYNFDASCFTVNGTAGVNKNLTSVSAWGNTAMTQNSAGYYSYNLTISNGCGYTVAGKVLIQFSRPGESGSVLTELINL
ncbi:inverse autotransporter beta domain-containing protein [Enterobacter quasihormaechei]|uniref:inverse autotransporter beta domain-containing protein n=1 Tax=Enterobacter quasihormaechei TaxID=2529382 RepID=UPI002F3F163F